MFNSNNKFQFETQQIQWIFYLFVLFHILLWTIIPTLIRLNLPLDTVEGIIWGQQLEWGYDKDPFLNGWLTYFAFWVGGQSGWLIYLASQLCVATCFWVVWRWGCQILNPRYALVAVLLMEGMQYFNLHVIDFDDNTLELVCWTLTVWLSRLALISNKTKYWAAVGVVAGLALMAKYYSAYILLVLLAYILCQRRYWYIFQQKGIYLAILLCIIIVTPHCLWLLKHDFLTLHYVLDRIQNDNKMTSSLYFPMAYLWEQTQVFLPSIVLLIILLIGKRPLLQSPRISINPDDYRFLCFVSIGPLLLTFILSWLFRMTLHGGWGAPLLTFWPLLLLVWLQPALTTDRLLRILTIVMILLSALAGGYAYSLIVARDESSANYPGKAMSTIFTRLWHEKYQTPLTIVAGPRWIAGNIAIYSPDHPSVYMEWSPVVTTWIHEKQMQKTGALFVWDAKVTTDIPPEIKQRYPGLIDKKIYYFHWQRDTRIPPVAIGAALLPPRGTYPLLG